MAEGIDSDSSECLEDGPVELDSKDLDKGYILLKERVNGVAIEGRANVRLILTRRKKNEDDFPNERIFAGRFANKVPTREYDILFELITSTDDFRRRSNRMMKAFENRLEVE